MSRHRDVATLAPFPPLYYSRSRYGHPHRPPGRAQRGGDDARHTEDRRSEIGDRRSEIGDRRSEIGDRRSEIGDRRDDHSLPAVALLGALLVLTVVAILGTTGCLEEETQQGMETATKQQALAGDWAWT
jgi:hypothetical protein